MKLASVVDLSEVLGSEELRQGVICSWGWVAATNMKNSQGPIIYARAL